MTSTEDACRLFQALPEQWCDWRWQLSHRLSTAAHLERLIRLTNDERAALTRTQGRLRCAITPYYATLMDGSNPTDPIRRTMIPTIAEFEDSPDAMVDPCAEDKHEVVPGLVHRYPDRVLVLPTNQCPVYCRYCTRNRWVGKPEPFMSEAALRRIVAYLTDHHEVRDVLISGGDPLILPDRNLDHLIQAFRAVPSVEIIRIGTKAVPALPMRVTSELVSLLRRHHPLWINIHFTHPVELTSAVHEACAHLADAGIPLNAQIVLLKGVNDAPGLMKALCQGLLRMRVRPYYLYQCDPVKGALHFRTSVSDGLAIMRQLRGHTTGLAVPTYVIDAPGGGGKIPLQPDYVVADTDGVLTLQNYTGARFQYANPRANDVR